MTAAPAAPTAPPDTGPAVADAAKLPPAEAPVCPYCGHEQPDARAAACESCKGLFEPLSRQATQNAMGPWQIRDARSPYLPGCSYDVLRAMALRGRITAATIIRGPTTRQFWQRAGETQGVAHLFGVCHACRSRVGQTDVLCVSCGERLAVTDDRQSLGLGPVRPLTAPASVRTAAVGEAIPAQHAADTLQPTRAASPALAELSIFEASPSLPISGEIPAPRKRPRLWPALALMLGVAALAAVALRVRNTPAPARTAPAQTPTSAITPAPAPAATTPASHPAPRPEGQVAPGSSAPAAEAASREAELNAAVEHAAAGTADAVREAIERLKRLRDATPTEARPKTLDAEIARLERRLDEIVLRRFL